MKLIVGLGNPGKKYEMTRHNLGFLVVTHLAQRLNVKFKPSSLTNALTADTIINGQKICFLMPYTMMNNSGVAVKHMVKKLDLNLDHVLVLCDDLNLDFDQLRIKSKGSDGGHNGLSSIIQHFQSTEFARLRMGIGHPGHTDEVVHYVLEEFGKNDKLHLNEFIAKASDCCLLWFKKGIDKAMGEFNQKNVC